jgi:hypothetical protein
VRALELSRNAHVAELPESMKEKLMGAGAAE